MSNLSLKKYIAKLSRFNTLIELKKTLIFKEEWIFSRCACLGNDVLKLISPNQKIFNIQKGRSDFIIRMMNNQQENVKYDLVYPFLKRKDIYHMLIQQSFVKEIFSLHPPKVIFIDSYSELTDQLFSVNNKWSFCCNYTDLNAEKNNIWKNFNRLGLMSICNIEKYYFDFFSLLRLYFKDIPIVFIHFPTKLDDRKKFKNRGKKIKSALSIIKKKFKYFYEIEANNNIVNFDPEDKFPYHYNKETYNDIAFKIKRLKLL